MVINRLPPPPAFGFDADRFPTWREGQDQAVLRTIDSTKRVVAQCLPVGSGKTLFAMATHKLSGGRTVILTRRKGLQDQLTREFSNVHDVRGQNAYPCIYSPSVSVDVGPCHVGMKCVYREHGCLYYDAVREARDPRTEVVVSNYAFWFFQAKIKGGLGHIDRLICDEAHGGLDELSNFLTIKIERWEVERLGVRWPEQFKDDSELWREWAVDIGCPMAEAELEKAKSQAGATSSAPAAVRERRRLESLVDRLQSLGSIEEDWVMEMGERGGSILAVPKWPRGKFLEKYLFQNVPKVILISGTIRPKTLELLGLTEKDYDYWEEPSRFPIDRRVIWCPDAPRMNHRIDEGSRGIWLDRIDQALAKRLDRRVIIHCGSYERRNYIMTHSRYAQYMMGHAREDVDQQIQLFKQRPAPAIFVSQSITEGFDFPYDDCRCQLIVKIPYPDSRNALTKARMKDDPEYGDYVAMQEMVQGSGRGMRAADDFCETLIIDGNSRWFFKRNARFAPKWWLNGVRQTNAIPDPPPLDQISRGTGRSPINLVGQR